MKSIHYSSIIKYLYYILFFILPFVVLPVNSELFEFNKMLFIYTISTLILGVWLLHCLQENRIIIKRTPFDIPLFLFLGSQIVSTLFSIDQHTSFFGYYGRFNGGLLSTIVYIFLYYGFVTHITENIPQVVRNIFKISLVSATLTVLWGLPGRFNHDLSCLLFTSKFDNSCWTAQFRPAERMFSTLGQPNWLGAYLSITFFMGIFLLFSSATKKSRIFSIVGILFSYAGILLSRSRSSLASLIPGILALSILTLFLYGKRHDWLTTFHKRAIIFIVGALIVLTFICQTGIAQVDSLLSLSFLQRKPTSNVSEIATAPAKPSLVYVGGVTESLDIRKIVWKGALELGMQYPLFGTGVETFGYAYYSVRPQSHNLTSEWDYLYNKAHDEYLNLFATTGWFGLGTFLVLFAWVVYYLGKGLLRSKTDINALTFHVILFGIVCSIGITNFFGFSITVINVYWYLLIAWLALSQELPVKKMENSNQRVGLSKIGITLLLVLWLLNSLYSYWLADYNYAQSDIALKSDNSGVAVNLLQKALTLREEHVYQDKLSYALAQYAFVASYQKEKDKAKQIIDAAESLNLKSIQSSPQNVLYWKTRVKNQFIFYQMSLDKKYLFTGLSALDEATKLAPTDPKIPYFSATYYSLLYDDEKNADQKKIYRENSMKSIETALTLKSDYGDAYYLKVQLLRKYGMKSEAKQLLEWYIPRYAPTNEGLKKELKEL